MADVFRLVQLPDPKRPVTLLDFGDNVTYFPWRDPPLNIVPGGKKPIAAAIDRRYGGSRFIGENTDNAQLQRKIRIKGSSADDAVSKAEALVQQFENPINKHVEWRPENTSFSTYFEVRGSATWAPTYSWAQFSQAKVFDIDLVIPVAPLARGACLDIWDDFAVNSISDYSFDAGAGQLAVSGGQLAPTGTAEKVIYHSVRGYSYSDVQVTVKFVTGFAALTTAFLGAVLRRLDANNRLQASWGASGISVLKHDGGSDTVLASTSAPAFAAFTNYWLRFRAEGNVLTVEAWTSEPTPMATPAASTSYTLAGVDATKFGQGIAGQAGLRVVNTGDDWRLDDFKVEPYTYRNRSLPERISLRGPIPGDAPALCDVTVTPSGGTSAPIFALFGWSQRAGIHNLVWNGDFEDDANGWSAAAVGSMNFAATSIVQTTSQAKYGAASGQITAVSGTTFSGANFTVYRRFKKGVTYTVEAWLRANSYTGAGELNFGNGSDRLNLSVTAFSTTWTRWSGTWTPTADYDIAYVGVNRATSGAADVFQIDGVMVYEGTTAPTSWQQSEGRGAYQPFGLLDAQACDTGDLVSWAITSDANYLGGSGLKVTTSGVGSALAAWFIDPTLLPPDDLIPNEYDIEVWARVQLDPAVVSPVLTLSVRPEAGANFGSERYSYEFGSTGKLLVSPITSASFRFVRLGSLRLDQVTGTRMKLRLGAAWAAGSSGIFGLDYLTLCPLRRRASSPSAKANDGTYPTFVNSTAETRKRITTDLQGYVSSPPKGDNRDEGLGGSLIQPTQGDTDLFVKLSSLVPDDPTATANSEQLAHNATVRLSNVTPRYLLARGA